MQQPFLVSVTAKKQQNSPALHYNKKWLPQLNTASAHFYALIQSSYHLSFLFLIYFLSRKKGSAVTLMSDRHSSTSHLQGESTPARIQKTNAMPGNPDTCFPLFAALYRSNNICQYPKEQSNCPREYRKAPYSKKFNHLSAHIIPHYNVIL